MLKICLGTVLMTSAFFVSAQTLSLNNYLESVKNKNEAFLAAQKNKSSAELKNLEAQLITMPQVFSSLVHIDDQKPRATPSISGTGLTNDSLSFGIQKQNSYGTSGKLYYTFQHTQVEGLSGLYASGANSYTGAPALELKQSLWRNGLGSETRATEELLKNSQLINVMGKNFELKSILIQAETAYLQLALAREMVRVQKEALERTLKIRDWNAKRVNMGLADKADLLQAEAGLQLKTLDVKNAIESEKEASRTFNSLRSVDSENVPEIIPTIDVAELDLPKNFVRIEEREDLAMARIARDSVNSNTKLSAEKILPTLDIVASASLNSLDNEKGEAFSQSLKADYPFWSVGLNFSAPIDFFTTKKLKQAYTTEAVSAELTYQRKRYENARELENLYKSLEDAKARLDLTFKMEKLQQEKLAYEKERLFKGKTVTYQVLQFEIDYANAQLMRLKEEGRIVGILANLKMYRGE